MFVDRAEQMFHFFFFVANRDGKKKKKTLRKTMFLVVACPKIVPRLQSVHHKKTLFEGGFEKP